MGRDRCMENTKSQAMGGVGQKICEPCDDCYNLVQDAANRHRANLEDLGNLLQQLAENPKPVGQEFEMQLKKLQVRVDVLVSDALISSENERRRCSSSSSVQPRTAASSQNDV